MVTATQVTSEAIRSASLSSKFAPGITKHIFLEEARTIAILSFRGGISRAHSLRITPGARTCHGGQTAALLPATWRVRVRHGAHVGADCAGADCAGAA